MTSAPQLLLLACLLTAFFGPATVRSSPTESPNPDARLLFKFIIIAPDSCNSVSGKTGICYSKQDCSSLVGTSDGNCAKGLGVCCTFTRTCDQQTKYQDTTFTNPLYPHAETTAVSDCDLIVIPMNENICQVRLDLVNFTLAQPNVDGVCADDFMTVMGGPPNVPKICGDNTGQHMYVDVEPNSTGNIKISIDSSVAGAKWNIKVTQIACTSTSRAPDGCLQYFTNTSGVVSSFNSPTSTLTADPKKTRQLWNQHYGVCIRSRPGYCGITWSPSNIEGNFSMTSDPTSIPPGTRGPLLVGDDCTTDYVIIPGGDYGNTTTPAPADRFCGFVFPTEVKSTVTPFVLYVVTNAVEIVTNNSDIGNQGFSLNYRATSC